jgi:hypothetical protein
MGRAGGAKLEPDYVRGMTETEPCWVVRMTIGHLVGWSTAPTDIGIRGWTSASGRAYRFDNLDDAYALRERLEGQGEFDHVSIEPR